MNDSGFNIGTTARDETVREIPLPISSSRYQYFKTTRHGLLNFVKRPSPEYAADMLSVEALRKEFLLCFPLSHPNLVRYIAFENSSLYEEYVDGMTLREMIDSNDERLQNPRFVLSVARQLFNVLDYIHRQGILHLDIKPENLMITRIGNTLKLIDFSCASSALSDTTAGFTPEYKAPEQGSGTDNCATDLYLAGKVVELLAEKGSATRKWKSFISKAVAPDPSLRFQSAEEALSALPGEATRKIPAYAYAVGILIVLIAAVLILWLSYKPYPSPETAEPEIAQTATDTPVASGDIIATPPPEEDTVSPPRETTSTEPTSPLTEPGIASIPETSPAPTPASVPSPVSAPAAVYPDHVYLVGNVEGNWMDPMMGIQVRGKNGVYTGEFEFTKSSGDRYSYFFVTERLGDSWNRSGSVWSAGSKKTANSDATVIEEGQTAQCNTYESIDTPFKLRPGKYTIKFDLKNSRLSITRHSQP